VIWRKDPLQIVKRYQEWASQKPEPRAVIIYDTMWNGTANMAAAIGEGFAEAGVDTKIFHAAISDRNDMLVEIFKARAVLIGSPTLNNGLLPSIAPIIEDIKGLGFKNKIGAAFGAYGWSGESVKIIEQHFKDAKIPLAREGIKAKWQPSADDLAACRAFGKSVAEVMKTA
jgi:flavorubredoxin